MFDYEKIPDWWALCPNRDCEMAATCLRHQVCMQVPQKYKLWTCVLPNAIEDGKCRFYQKAEKVTMAQGIAAVYKNVQSREARSLIRYALTAHLFSDTLCPHGPSRQQGHLLSLQEWRATDQSPDATGDYRHRTSICARRGGQFRQDV